MSLQKSRERLAVKSQQFSPDIAHEEFYVPTDAEDAVKDELEANELEATARTTISIQELSKKKEPGQDDEIFDLSEEASPEKEEKVQEEEKKEDAEEPGTDFFDKVVDDEAEKKQPVYEIAGMTEIEKESAEEEAPGEKLSAIQFKFPKDEDLDEAGGKRKSCDELPGLSTRGSRAALQELREISKKSLITLAGSSVSAALKKEKDGNVSVGGLGGIDLSLLSSMEYYKDVKTTPQRSRSKSAVFFDMGPRFKQIDDEDLLLGFDITDTESLTFDVSQEEEEEVVLQEEEMAFKLDRTPYYQRHDKAAQEIAVKKMKNLILHKKLSMYFKRKKIDYVTREYDWSFAAQSKYIQKLEAYGDLLDYEQLTKGRLAQELDEIKLQKSENFEKLTSMFKKMQDREREIGYGLINRKTGKAIPDKHVEQLIRRQSIEMTQVSSMRFSFIKLKGMVQEKLDAISSLDEIAPGFLLADFEQLKRDNRTYADKIEEKDEELNKLRTKCSNTIQILAHLREKSFAMDSDLVDLTDERDYLESLSFCVRSKLNQQKLSRDTVRHSLNKMRDESGLLTQPTLLKDMEKNLRKEKILSEQLSQIMKEHNKRAKQITTIRKKIEQTVDLRRNMSRKSLTKVTSVAKNYIRDKHCNVYKGGPSLLLPVIGDHALDSISSIKPMVTYNRSQRSLSNLKHNKRKVG